ncbi:MAG: glycoside hydrolase family 2 TIM barrel-domain containing protein [Verrucomicrobiales bacterium]
MQFRNTSSLVGLAFVALISLTGIWDTKAQSDEAVEVKLLKAGNGWSLSRAGEPHRIQGAGGTASLEVLAGLGANSTRTWGIDQLDEGRLDEAARNGLTVAVGIWLRHDLDYADEKQVDEQIRLALEGVRKYKDHPAVLVWGIGNEMEGAGDNPAVWKHIETIAKLVKREDPLHPTMTVIAEIGGEKVKNLHHLCHHIDIVGINAYGGAESLPKRYRAAGGAKPYIVTEFGPRGPWDLPKNAIGSVDEELGSVKAETYLKSFQAVSADRQLCLGSYAFKWGHKQEATPTWFGMLLADGRKTPVVDVLSKEWFGRAPANLCPQIDSLKLVPGRTVKVGATMKATLDAHDPEKQPLKVQWVLMEDAKSHYTGGYFQETPPTYKELILKTSSEEVTFRAPKKPGLYRIFAYVGDGQGSVDAANIVFRAEE